ncbi:DNA oxidative demethylase AlkB [Alkanindiges sp. WGS2144]|uniref:DNA oxidative demethylase AlkB n=1 Tax=Alkanindiges sp. WGS2144 TaxID=3366808 RepID=UPI00375377BC
MTMELFDWLPATSYEPGSVEKIGEQAVVLRGLVNPMEKELIRVIEQITAISPFRHMRTAYGGSMSAALTSCGELGWVADQQGYRYQAIDPLTGQPWPSMPALFLRLAQQAASQAGFESFRPSSCLMNEYTVDARMGLHQDKDEINLNYPVVSVSLGIPAIFLWGGLNRKDATQKIGLFHGDVVVWGGVDRLRFHGIAPLKPACHPLLGERRINMTFRQAD